MNTSILGIKMLFLQQFNKIAVMDTIQIKDKRFTPFIPEERILKEVARVASEINRDLSCRYRRYCKFLIFGIRGY